MTIENRLEILEAELSRAKRWNRLLMIAALLSVVVMAAGIGRVTTTESVGGNENAIKANAFLVVDKNGKLRATLAMDKDGPSLILADENEKPRAILAMYKKFGPTLGLRDENGELRAALAVHNVGPLLNLSDENGKPRIVMSVHKTGPLSWITDENGNSVWQAPP
jgi:hypothetical protein